MRSKVVAVVLFFAGLSASFALAGPPAGKGKGHNATTTTTAATTTTGATTSTSSSTTTTTGSKADKVTLCQPTGSKTHPYSKITVAASSVKAHIKKGDVRPDADGKCPSTAPTTSTETTTTSPTTTAATTITTAATTTTPHA
jgi:hypothetical protein